MPILPIDADVPQQLAGTRWRVDPSASSAEFQVPHFWGLVTVKGHFERLDGRVEIDESRQLQMTLTIDAASLHTGIGRRDKHRQHPRAPATRVMSAIAPPEGREACVRLERKLISAQRHGLEGVIDHHRRFV